MATTKIALTRNLLADALAGVMDRLTIRTAGGAADLVTFTITWGAASAGAAAVASTPVAGTAGAAGTAAEAKLHNVADTHQVTGFLVDTAATVAWATATAYVVSDKRLNGGVSYVCTEAHTSDADTEPGVGPSWPDMWDQIHITMDNLTVASGQTVNLASFVWTEPATTQG